jgi:hypothetical protein
MTPIFLSLFLALGQAPAAKPASESKPPVVDVKPAAPVAATAEGKPAQAEAKKPVLLKRASGERTKKSADQPDVQKMVPPAEPGRNIPGPPTEPKTKEDPLDTKLLDELGGGLTKPADEDEKDPLLRANERMRKVEEKLAAADGNVETVDLQTKIVKDLDELLEAAQNQNNNQNKSKKNSKSRKMQKVVQRNETERERQQRMERERQQAEANQKNMAKGEAKKANDNRDQVGGPAGSRQELGEGRKKKDVWGHLSESMRQEMEQYAREGFLPRYRDLLEKYYTSIASRAKRKEIP